MMAGKRILSLGDRVGQLVHPTIPIVYMDISPSSFSLRQVRKMNMAELRQFSQDPEVTILLMYSWYGMTVPQRHILQSAKAKVVIWSQRDEYVFQYNSVGVTSNRPIDVRALPTERSLFVDVPWAINFSFYKGHVFLDLGIMVDYLVRSCLKKDIRMKDPTFSEYKGIKIEPGEPQEGETYVAHEWATWKKNASVSPYFVPTGRKHDRVIPVSKSMTAYKERTLYSFEGERFYTEVASKNWCTLENVPGRIAGFFRGPYIGPGLAVIPLEAEVENIFVKRVGSHDRVEINGRTYYHDYRSGRAEDSIASILAEFADSELFSFQNYLKYLIKAPSMFKLVTHWVQKNREKCLIK